MFFNKILNNKGAILPITITAMVVIMVAGLACLRTFAYQDKLNDLDKTKIRLEYAAMGAVEICREAISTSTSDDIYTSGINDPANSNYYKNYDNVGSPTIGYYVKKSSYTGSLLDYGLNYSTGSVIFKIEGVARARVVSPDDGKTRIFVSTMTYFYSQDIANSDTNKYFIGWSKKPIDIKTVS